MNLNLLLLLGVIHSYEVQDPPAIKKILDNTSCMRMIFHEVQSSILVGWRIGKLKVEDEEGPYNWPENAQDYRIKRRLTLYFFGNEPAPKLVLRSEPCGVDPVNPKPLNPF